VAFSPSARTRQYERWPAAGHSEVASNPFRAGLLDLAGQDADNIRSALGQGGDFALIDVETGNPKLLLGVQQGEGQTDVAQPMMAIRACRCSICLSAQTQD